MSVPDAIILFAALVCLISSAKVIIQKQLLGNAGLVGQRVILDGTAAVFYGIRGLCISGLLIVNVPFLPDNRQLSGHVFSLINIVGFYLFIWIISIIMQIIKRS